MNEQFIEERIKGCKKEKKRGIVLLCRPLFVFGLRFIASLIFRIIAKTNGDGELIGLIKNFVNWIFGLLLMLYIFALPAGIILVVNGNSELKKIKNTDQ